MSSNLSQRPQVLNWTIHSVYGSQEEDYVSRIQDSYCLSPMSLLDYHSTSHTVTPVLGAIVAGFNWDNDLLLLIAPQYNSHRQQITDDTRKVNDLTATQPQSQVDVRTFQIPPRPPPLRAISRTRKIRVLTMKVGAVWKNGFRNWTGGKYAYRRNGSTSNKKDKERKGKDDVSILLL